MISTLTDKHKEVVLDMLEGSESEIRIISPFISVSIAKLLCKIVAGGLNCTFITRLYLEDMICKANSLDAVKAMMDAGIKVYAVQGLHTKLYLSDKNKAILGSANFTVGGFKSNIELSLYMEDEPVIDELNQYYDELLRKTDEGNGLVTPDLVEEIDKSLTLLFGKKKDGRAITTSLAMYGADVGLISQWSLKDTDKRLKELQSAQTEANDVITNMFREMDAYEQIFYDYNIWLKFTGRGNDRHDGNEMARVFSVPAGTGRWYLATYSQKPSQVQPGDEIYITPLTTDRNGKNQPVIVGRGRLRGFSKKNYAKDEWMKLDKWLEQYPWYCIIDECEILNTENKNGIPLDAILNHLGSDTYIASYGRNESPVEVGKKHHQKAHLRLSGNAKDFIDKRFDELVKKYGSTIVISEE